MIPSKELLSEVLNDKKILLSKNDLLIGDNVLLFDNQCNYLVNINIYELAHKCKEWAKKKEYWAISGYDEGYFCMLHDMPDNRFFNASTEIEAIFKACEYIMEQTKCGS